jgi:1-acyl-sn-glycerol-3-phosphate acyltransferase
MRIHGIEAPNIARRALTMFHLYARWYMYRHLHAIRVNTLRPPRLSGLPIVVCMNHPSWWDPLVAMTLALRLFPERRHYAPMESNSLSKFGFFERIGFFGVEPGSPKGAAKFLRVASGVLENPEGMLWVTAQGTFSDVRHRPVTLRSGLGHLAARKGNFALLPVAFEYPHWEERLPEALVRFGEPIIVAGAAARSPEQWTATFAHALECTQDELAAASMARSASAFEVLAYGGSGVGGIYGGWRWARAKVRRA